MLRFVYMLFLLLSSPAFAYQAALSTNVAYGSDPSQKMDVCTPRNYPMQSVGIILIHGGGYTSGDKLELRFLCLQLATKGFAAFSINYRFMSDPGSWPRSLSDGQLALRYVRQNAATWNVNPSKIGAYGYSAGGHMAAFMAIKSVPLGDMAGILPGVATQALFAVGITPLIATGQNATTAAAQADAQTSPTYLVVGSRDQKSGCTAALNKAYYDTLIALGVTASRYRVYSGGHVWAGADARTKTAIENDINAWMLAR